MARLSRRPRGARRSPTILTALILGSANTLADDQARALELFTPDLVIACNHAARDHPGRVDHWVTMHPDLYPMWLQKRREDGHPEPGRLWHARHRICPDEILSWPVESWGGSSGLLCVAVALELGVERAVLAGVPMMKTAKHYDDERPWTEARQYHWAWQHHRPKMLGRVKSMSGWTRDLLGSPEDEEGWLGDTQRASAAPR